MKTETLDKVVRLIGQASTEELMILSDSINSRHRHLKNMEAVHNRQTLKVGSRVKLKNLKPKYLNGTKAVVLEVKGDKGFLVELEPNADPRAFRRFGNKPIVPANCLQEAGEPV